MMDSCVDDDGLPRWAHTVSDFTGSGWWYNVSILLESWATRKIVSGITYIARIANHPNPRPLPFFHYLQLRIQGAQQQPLWVGVPPMRIDQPKLVVVSHQRHHPRHICLRHRRFQRASLK